MPSITHFCGDLPAKADVQGMVMHNGHNACGFCLHPGVAVKKDSKSKSVVRYVRGQNETPRTHAKYLPEDKINTNSRCQIDFLYDRGQRF